MALLVLQAIIAPATLVVQLSYVMLEAIVPSILHKDTIAQLEHVLQVSLVQLVLIVLTQDPLPQFVLKEAIVQLEAQHPLFVQVARVVHKEHHALQDIIVHKQILLPLFVQLDHIAQVEVRMQQVVHLM